ncbi:hypothetical protein L6452_43718 [Arctium lappa]|uniref:Uncharacterized protein n=1 Tax=Arctium lappa TaxID=4217 RepID=A0ACB8XEX9_ARCLA|nr:hypothetical protein L6452_43718 [Arctium lappa]
MGQLCAPAAPLDHNTYRTQITVARVKEMKEAAEQEYVDIPYKADDDDVDYGPERLIIHGPTADDRGAEPSERPPPRRVRAHRTGSSSSAARRNQNE